MAYPSIKWRDTDKNELQRINKNARAKLNRLEKQKPELQEFLPEIKKRSDFTNRQDFNNYIKEIKRFTERGSEKIVEYKGFEVPKYFKKEAIIAQTKENKIRSEQRKQISNEMGTNTKSNRIATTPVKLEKSKNTKDLVKRVEHLKTKNTKQVQKMMSDAYKKNYFETVDKNLNEYGRPIISLLQDIDGKILAKYAKGNVKLSVEYTYSPQQQEIKANDIYNEWCYVLGLERDYEEEIQVLEELDY